jgi:protein-arginine deiminase
MTRPTLPSLLALGLASLLAACDGEVPPPHTEDPGQPEQPAPWAPTADLRADGDRDGTVELDDPADDVDEEAWTAARGAVFLANLDDDGERCSLASFPLGVSDVQLAACHDASDSVVNGPSDLLDLARLRVAPLPDAPDDAVGSVTVRGDAAAEHVRLFVREGDAFVALAPGKTLGPVALRQGVELALEGRDVVRDPLVWDGSADVLLTLSRPGHGELSRDVVRLRVAPVVTVSHLAPVQTLHVADSAVVDAHEDAFLARMEEVRAAVGLAAPLARFESRDRWIQDFFEPAYMALPAAGGRQHTIRVNLRSAEVYYPAETESPLRSAGRIVYAHRGPDVAALQQYALGGTFATRTYNAMGNTETVPPFPGFPLGRLLRGSAPGAAPDPSFTRMLDAQGVQPAVTVDTSWLQVGHVDETLAFLPSATSPRGWVLLVADPSGARALLEDVAARGHGDAALFAGQSWRVNRQDVPAETTVARVLADAGVASASATAAAGVERQLQVLRQELGLTEADLVRAPFLFQPHAIGKVTAYQPATANLLVLSPTDVAAPDPHGPVVDGVDVFKAHFEAALAPHGLRVHWVDDWHHGHRYTGNLHCLTNATRAIPETRWWTMAR